MDVVAWPISGLEIALEQGDAPALPPGADRAWGDLCEANPRLFDGPIYRVIAQREGDARLRVALDSYRRLAVQDHPAVGDLGVRLLGVKAVITGHDAGGREHALIARRHPQTRSYGGMWEVGPGGSVGPRDVPREALAEAGLLRHLAREAEEELGLDLAGSTRAGSGGVWLLRDELARSVDVVFHREWQGAINARGGACRREDRDWEYIDTAWLARDDLAGFVRSSRQSISPATLAIFTSMLAWAW